MINENTNQYIFILVFSDYTLLSFLSRRSEAACTSVGDVQIINLFDLGQLYGRDDHLGDPLKRLYRENSIGAVEKPDAYLTAVVGIHHADTVGGSNALFDR